MKKKLIAAVLATAMVVGMTGCGGSGSSDKSAKASKDEDGKIEINFYEHSDATYIQQFVDAYEEKNPDVKINLTIIANDDYDDKLKVMLAGGNDVDCFWIRSGTQARKLSDQGALMALDDLCKENDLDTSVFGECQKAYELNGKTYGLATTKSAWMIFYNKALFDQAGVSYPSAMTWDEYTELAKSLTTDELRGGLIPNWSPNLGSAASGEYLTDAKLEKTKEWVNYLDTWYVKDKSHYGLEEMSGSFDTNGIFAEGNTYMMINGDWTFSSLDSANPEFEWDCAPLPTFEGDEGATAGSTSVYAINSKCDDKKAAAVFDFMKFISYSDEGAKLYAENTYVAAYPSDEAKDIYLQNNTKSGAGYMFEANIRPEAGTEVYYDEIITAFKEETELALVGSSTIDEAFDNFVGRREEIISSYK